MINFEASRTRLIEHLSSEIKDKRVLAAMSRIPREIFVPLENRQAAYDDKPLPIGWDQTISQPFIIAYMTEALELAGDEKVLELGTGSGYQTAILAELCRWVVTVERIPELADSARELLDSFGYNNIEVHLAEGSLGWPHGAPYDAIMVTAGAPSVPDELLEQLAPGGRMVIPVGSRYMQELCKITKCQDKNQIRNLGGCRFVSLIGKSAWAK